MIISLEQYETIKHVAKLLKIETLPPLANPQNITLANNMMQELLKELKEETK